MAMVMFVTSTFFYLKDKTTTNGDGHVCDEHLFYLKDITTAVGGGHV
ncbi:hypothetical protein GFS24_04420 [Chitinophaga sp. SYP-B3965]|nr:hypothetical protein [Chitinophaga sp. SYP-B3965]MRG44341.1 hypothetical protein [Chitinophaga sp. SYP-B3965]MRG44343.1 hypothetical protein [Chitinophaga sp. SYP-B3965]